MQDGGNEEENLRLYAKTRCLACNNKLFSCPYCDGKGYNYTEASTNAIIEWIKGCPEDIKEKIRESIEENNGNKQ